MLNDDLLFTKRGLAHLHDAVLDGCDLSLGDDALKALFFRLPQCIQDSARQWGLSDTPVRDGICVWAQENIAEVAAIGK